MQRFWIHTPRLSLRPDTVHDGSAAEQFLGDAETMGFDPAPFRVAEKIGMRLEKEFTHLNNEATSTVGYVLGLEEWERG